MTEQNMLGLLSVFNCENSLPRGDIVFVHGVAGHPWGTWHPQSKTDKRNVDFWLFWLGEELQGNGIDVNVWTFGYDVPSFKDVGEGMPRFDQASNLLKYLEVNDIGDQRPFIFVTHSMGGLVVKEAIRTAQNFPQYQTIIKQVQGIVFLSAPHTGIHLDNLIQNIGFLTKLTVNVEELKRHSSQLRDLNEWYQQNVEKLGIKTEVFYETRPIEKAKKVLVVDEDSANPGIKDVKPVAIRADHNSIAKPGKNDLVYLSVKKVCQQIFTFSGVSRIKEGSQLLISIPDNLSCRTGANKFGDRDKVIDSLHQQFKLQPIKSLFLGLGVSIVLIIIIIIRLVFFYEKSTENFPIKKPLLSLNTPITNLEEYTQLTYLLELKEWKKADQKTAEIIRIRANRQKEGFLNGESVRNFSCDDLRVIDNLWKKNSDERFGFSIQKQIWEDIAKNPEIFDLQTYQKFLEYIGWYKNKPLSYDNLMFKNKSPRGHLPHTGIVGIWARGEDGISLLLSCDFK